MAHVVMDPIHGNVLLEEHEWKAIDTPVFQRLRRIHQLALVYLVYPGATHTRFEHSIGVRAVADLLCAQLEKHGLNEDERTTVRNAALVHDLGHGPFSHSSEQVVDELAGQRGMHERISIFIARHDELLRNALGTTECDAATDLLETPTIRSAVRDIVSGPTDADKLDYLLRDSYFTGVIYGHYDLLRILDSAAVIGDLDVARGSDTVETYLGFEASGIWAVESLLLARHHMHRTVYGHRTSIATDIMITKAIHAGIEEGTLSRDAYQVEVDDNGKPVVTDRFLELYLGQTDEVVLKSLCEGPADSAGRDLAERLLRRELLKQTVQIELHRESGKLGARRIERIMKLGRTDLAVLEEEIARQIGIDKPYLVALFVDSQTNPTYRTAGTSIQPKDIILQPRNRGDVLLQELSEIFQESSGPNREFLYLYTPELSDVDGPRAEEALWNTLETV